MENKQMIDSISLSNSNSQQSFSCSICQSGLVVESNMVTVFSLTVDSLKI